MNWDNLSCNFTDNWNPPWMFLRECFKNPQTCFSAQYVYSGYTGSFKQSFQHKWQKCHWRFYPINNNGYRVFIEFEKEKWSNKFTGAVRGIIIFRKVPLTGKNCKSADMVIEDFYIFAKLSNFLNFYFKVFLYGYTFK